MNSKLTNLFTSIIERRYGSIRVDGFDISFFFDTENERLVLSTSLFSGDGSLPEAVLEKATAQVLLGEDVLQAELFEDKENHEILLRYSEGLDQISYARFTELVDELAWLAGEWQELFHEDLKDLSFAYISR